MSRRVVALLAMTALAGCGSPPPLQTFPPLDYSYLPPITLKVSSINVVNNYQPDPGAAALLAQDPVPPGDELQTVLTHRLIAGGAPGMATATIETASIDQVGGNLVGTLTVQLSLTTPDGKSTGYTEASVVQTDTAPDPGANQNQVQAALYTMTKELMTAMNNQLQYQINHSLGTWVVGGTAGPGGGSLVPGGVQATPLTPPGSVGPQTGTAPTQIPPALQGASPTAIPPGPPAPLLVPNTPPAASMPAPTPAPAPAFNPANVGL
jgi:hypothetical protein